MLFFEYKKHEHDSKSQSTLKGASVASFPISLIPPIHLLQVSHCSLCCYHLATIPCRASSYYTCNNQQSLPHSFSQLTLQYILSALSESITFTYYFTQPCTLYTLVLASLPDDDGGGWSISIASWNFPSSFPLHIHISKQYIFSLPSLP